MSKLEKLIAELCPDGVEYKKIKDVYTRLKGTSITAGKMKDIAKEDGDIRIFAGGKTIIDTNEDYIPNANITRCPAVLVQSRGIIDFVYYDKPFTFKNEMWAYTHKENISTKYLLYFLRNNVDYFRKAASGMGSLPQISLSITEDFQIPIPPLPVQEEIVRILDTFTQLTAELQNKLQAELQARKKQYEYYRDELICKKGHGVEEILLADIANYSSERISAKDVNEDNYIGVDNLLQDKKGKILSQHVVNKGSLTKYYPHDILIGNIMGPLSRPKLNFF